MSGAKGKHRSTPSMAIVRTVDKIAVEQKRNQPLRTIPFKSTELGAAVRSFCSNKPGSFLSNRCYKNLTPPIIGIDCFTYENKNAEVSPSSFSHPPLPSCALQTELVACLFALYSGKAKSCC
jgi:hypothetical protein